MNRRTFSALLASLVPFGCRVEQDMGPEDMANLSESRALGDAKSLDVLIEYGVGDFALTSAANDQLFSFDLDYDRSRQEPSFRVEGTADRPRVYLKVDEHGSIRFGSSRRRGELNFKLTDTLPMDLEVKMGVTEADIDVTGLKLRQFRLTGGVGKTEVVFAAPATETLSRFEVKAGVGEINVRGLGFAHVERFEFKGGVGKAELDFTGDRSKVRTDADVTVGVGQLHLLIPRDLAVEVHGNGSFLSNITAPSFEKDGSRYFHAMQSSDAADLRLTVKTGIGGVNIDLV